MLVGLGLQALECSVQLFEAPANLRPSKPIRDSKGIVRFIHAAQFEAPFHSTNFNKMHRIDCSESASTYPNSRKKTTMLDLSSQHRRVNQNFGNLLFAGIYFHSASERKFGDYRRSPRTFCGFWFAIPSTEVPD